MIIMTTIIIIIIIITIILIIIMLPSEIPRVPHSTRAHTEKSNEQSSGIGGAD